MTAYIGYVRKDADSDYGVEFPDVPGCVSAGHTLEEARAMAAEALAGHLAELVAGGDPLPKASGLDALKDDPDRGDALIILVETSGDLLKSETIDVAIPRHLLGRIDAASGGDRDGFLIRAAEKALAGN